MNNWKNTEPCKKPDNTWRLVLLFIVFMILESLIICIVGPEMNKKENPNCCPIYDQRVKSWREIWNK